MCNELQSQHEEMEPRSMLLHLIELFVEQSIYFVQAHLIELIEWIQRLAVTGEELSSRLVFFFYY